MDLYSNTILFYRAYKGTISVTWTQVLVLYPLYSMILTQPYSMPTNICFRPTTSYNDQ